MDEAQIFLSQLQTMPYTHYCDASSPHIGFMLSLAVGTLCFILNIVTRQYSWVDRLWPLLPIFHAINYLYHQQTCSHIPVSTRQVVMIVMITIWGLRLTHNFARKGGFKKGGQDYRWVYLRQNYHWIVVELLNFFFIAYYQNILIQWFTSPILNSYKGDFNFVDIIVSVLWIILFVVQVLADQQQWDFQSEKYRLLKENGGKKEELPLKYKIGFATEGLFRYSRHPNFFCEISMWYMMALFSINSSGLNWTVVGAILLHLLFFGSTGLTEKISSQKYPLYKEYQKNTSRFIFLPAPPFNPKQE